MQNDMQNMQNNMTDMHNMQQETQIICKYAW